MCGIKPRIKIFKTCFSFVKRTNSKRKVSKLGWRLWRRFLFMFLFDSFFRIQNMVLIPHLSLKSFQRERNRRQAVSWSSTGVSLHYSVIRFCMMETLSIYVCKQWVHARIDWIRVSALFSMCLICFKYVVDFIACLVEVNN